MWVYQATLRMLKPMESNSSIPLFSTLFAGGLAGTYSSLMFFWTSYFIQ